MKKSVYGILVLGTVFTLTGCAKENESTIKDEVPNTDKNIISINELYDNIDREGYANNFVDRDLTITDIHVYDYSSGYSLQRDGIENTIPSIYCNNDLTAYIEDDIKISIKGYVIEANGNEYFLQDCEVIK